MVEVGWWVEYYGNSQGLRHRDDREFEESQEQGKGENGFGLTGARVL